MPSMGMQTTSIGGTQENYFMLSGSSVIDNSQKSFVDPWHYPTVKIVAACRANGLLPIDGPLGIFLMMQDLIAQAKRSATLGMVGKGNSSQASGTNQFNLFTFSEQVNEAKEILATMDAAKKSGKGAVVYKGRLIDIASIKQAEVIIDQAENINVREVGHNARLFRI